MTMPCFLIICWLMFGAALMGNIILENNNPEATIGRKLIAFGIMFVLILVGPILFIYNKFTHKLW